MSCELPSWLLEALVASGVASAPEAAAADGAALSGGVSSDVWRVDVAGRSVCVKRALPVLKVAAHWEAPVERSASEAAWLARAQRIDSEGAPPLLGVDASTGAIVLGWLDPSDHVLWKSELLSGRVDAAVAASLGARLGRFHAGMSSSQDPAAPNDFANRELFDALRLSPYFRSTAEVHPALASQLDALCHRFDDAASTVVHGDVSPKNVLVGPNGPVLLDAECACWGDPAFDVAFLLTHLLLKARHLPQHGRDLHAAAAAFWRTYESSSNDPSLEARTVAYWSALILARLDGRSPVEYLADDVRSAIRNDVLGHVARPGTRLADLDPLWRIDA